MAALVKAIERKRFKQAKILLELGDDVNQQEKLSGRTPLLAVCFIEDENLACRITKKLLSRGADVCLQDVQGMSPLMQACKLGKEKLAKVLIQSDECDFGATDIKGNTALIYSIDAGKSRITKALTEAMNAYDVRAADKPNRKGETPLIRAMKLQQNDCMEVLLSDGKASPHARDFDLKLNAREWEIYLKEKEEDENKSKAKNEDAKEGIRKARSKDGLLNGQQSKDHFERSPTSSIIYYRKNLKNMANAEGNSVKFTPDSKKNDSNETFLPRRTKSAPPVKCKNPKLLPRSVTFNFEPRSVENCISKSGFPEKKKVCFENETPTADETSPQIGITMATTGPCGKQQTSIKLDDGDWLVTKEAFSLTDKEQQNMSLQNACENNREKQSCSQNQLPKLFTLMTQQSTHSFRSSAKKKTSEDPRDQRKSGSAKELPKRRFPRRNSTATQRKFLASNAGRRWSTATTSLTTLERFSSLYSRADFTALNPENLATQEKLLFRRRRSSTQSTPEDLCANFKAVKTSETNTATISPNLVKLNPDLSSSLPEQRTLSRIKSGRPRLYARHNSDSFLSSGNLLNGLATSLTATPVIEEAEE